MTNEEGAYMLLTNCPACILSLENGLELMRESGEPMEFGIFFARCFQGLLVKGEMGQQGLEWKPGDIITDPKHR
jgi:heterodisulfide reductase subunit B